jgi:hypothetical protein
MSFPSVISAVKHRLKLVEETRKRGGKGEAFGGAEGLFDDFTAEISAWSFVRDLLQNL